MPRKSASNVECVSECKTNSECDPLCKQLKNKRGSFEVIARQVGGRKNGTSGQEQKEIAYHWAEALDLKSTINPGA